MLVNESLLPHSPITDGSRASSQGSLDGIGGATTTAIQLGAPPGAMLSNTLGTTVVVTTSAGSVQQGGPVAHRCGSVSPDEEVHSVVLIDISLVSVRYILAFMGKVRS